MEYVNGGEVSGYTLYLKPNFIVLLCYQPPPPPPTPPPPKKKKKTRLSIVLADSQDNKCFLAVLCSSETVSDIKII